MLPSELILFPIQSQLEASLLFKLVYLWLSLTWSVRPVISKTTCMVWAILQRHSDESMIVCGWKKSDFYASSPLTAILTFGLKITTQELQCM